MNNRLKTPKYAVFGGTFDPFHSDHLTIIKSLYQNLGLDYVVVVPSYNPPHKNSNISSFSDRCQLIDFYVKDYPWIIIDTIENELAFDKSYTYLILNKIKKKYGQNLLFVMGGDSFINFMSWKNPELIAKVAPIIIIPRNLNHDLAKHKDNIENSISIDATIVNIELLGISSSLIRAYFEVGLSHRTVSYLHPRAIDFILEKNLYSNFNSYVSKLERSLSKELFHHSIETAIYSVKLATIHELNSYDAFLSGLLHDYAKEDKFNAHDFESYPWQIVHQFLGAEKAKTDFSINDNIYEAIKFHATGAPDMTSLGMLAYCADKLEATRAFEGVEKLREITEKDLLEGFKSVLYSQYVHLIATNKNICKLTKQAMLWYNI